MANAELSGVRITQARLWRSRVLCGLPLERLVSDRANQRAAAVSHLSVKNKSGEPTRRDAQLGVTAARSAAVTTQIRRGANQPMRKTAEAYSPSPSLTCCALRFYHFNMGSFSGGINNRIDRACPGTLLIRPFSSSFRIIW
jgi:hypothetical protein